MWRNYFGRWGFGTGIFPGLPFFPLWLLLLLVALEIILKGISLYRSARNGQKCWFVAILILNTIGILPLIYLLFFSEKKKKK